MLITPLVEANLCLPKPFSLFKGNIIPGCIKLVDIGNGVIVGLTSLTCLVPSRRRRACYHFGVPESSFVKHMKHWWICRAKICCLFGCDTAALQKKPGRCLRRDKFVGLFPGFLYMHRNPASLANRLFGAKITGDGMGSVTCIVS